MAAGIVKPEGALALPAKARCWGPQECRRGLMHGTGPDLGSPDQLAFISARSEWEFTATFTPLGESCPRATTVAAEPTGDLSFRLVCAGPAGTYQVDLGGGARKGS